MKNSNWWLNSELQSLRAKSNMCRADLKLPRWFFCNLMVSTLISLIHFETVCLFDLCPKSTPGVKTVSAVLTECTKLHISVYSLEKQSGTNKLEAISEKTFILTAALLWVSKKEKSLCLHFCDILQTHHAHTVLLLAEGSIWTSKLCSCV